MAWSADRLTTAAVRKEKPHEYRHMNNRPPRQRGKNSLNSIYIKHFRLADRSTFWYKTATLYITQEFTPQNGIRINTSAIKHYFYRNSMIQKR